MPNHPIGTYTAEIAEHGLCKSKNAGTPQVAVRFVTMHGPIMAWFPLTDRAVEYTMEKLLAMGFTGNTFSSLNSDCLVGNKCVIVIDEDEYNGQKRPRVKFVNPEGDMGGGAEIKKDQQAAQAASRFDALLRKINSNPTEQGPRRPRIQEQDQQEQEQDSSAIQTDASPFPDYPDVDDTDLPF